MSSKRNKDPTGEKKTAEQLLNLEVKVLTQQLGTANQWAIRAEGRVTFSDLTIRVYAIPKDDGLHGKSKSADDSELIVLEDSITTETPFVGENCCIVWNSVEQQLSLCLMYASEEGYAASWSALVAMQDKTYPAFGFDLLEQCSSKLTDPLPYNTIINTEYDPPLGFIERHALSLSVIENRHYDNPALYSSKDVVFAMLEIANVDLVEYFISPEVYPLFAASLGCSKEPAVWTTPTGLEKLQLSDELVSYIVKDLHLISLQEEVLEVEKNPEIVAKMKSLGDKLRNELACTLLSSDRTLTQAKEALMIMPPASTDTSSAADGSDISPKVSYDRYQSDVLDKMTACSKAEQQVAAYLHFFRCLVRLCLTELGPDLLGPIILKIFHCGLLEALSFVAERYALPKGLSAGFLAALNEDRGGRQFGRSGNAVVQPNATITGNTCYNKVIEYELTCLLDSTVIRLNERQEDQLMNDIIRSPILAEPSKYNGLMTFLFRQHLSERVDGVERNAGNPFLLFHILGLHDDETVMPEDRELSTVSEPAAVKEKFQSFVVSKYVPLVARGMLAVPSPPKEVPLVQFQLTGSPKTLQLPQGISPPLIRVLEFLVLSVNPESKSTLLKAVFSHKSVVLQYIEGCFETASKDSSAIRRDVLCGNVRFLKAILSQLMPESYSSGLDRMSVPTSSPQSVPRNTVTQICRALTVERDTLGYVLQAYLDYGGHRRNSLFHSSVLSMLDLIVRKQSTTKSESEGNDLRDVRDYIFFKHFDKLPRFFSERFRQSLLAEITTRLGEETGYLGSVSVLSSVAGSELLRSTSKLRFVDEVEAATGGVDGTVKPSTISGLSPNMVANMQDAAEDKMKKRMRATVSSIWGQSGGSGGAGNAKLTIGGSGSADSPTALSKAPTNKIVLKPTVPKSEKQAVARPQRGLSVDSSVDTKKAESASPASEDHVVLPKLKKRAILPGK